MKELKRYVVQKHHKAQEQVHWDLMLEAGGVLETYRLPEPPEKWRDKAIEAVKIFDHPLKFLNYEGSVNKGKGRVEIADCGMYSVIRKDETQKQISFSGNVLKGEFLLNLKEDGWELRGV